MNRLRHVVFAASAWLCLAVVLFAQAPTSVLQQIPGDARGFVLVRGLDATGIKIDALATRVQAPLPKLNNMLVAFEKGLDKQRSLGVAWLPQRDGDDAQSGLRHFVIYIPVTDYAEFIGQLGAEDGNGSITEGTLHGQPVVVAKKGDYAIVAQLEDKGSLEHVLNAAGRISEISKPLHDWLELNDVTIALSPSGTELLFAKLKEGLQMIKAGAAAVPGGGAEMVEASLEMYQAMFDAAEREFTQVAVGLRIDPEKSIEIHKRLLLSPDGGFVKASLNLKRPENASVRMPAGPFVLAFEGAMPADWSRGLMAQSFNILKAMQGPDAGELTQQQLDQLGDVAAKAMQGVQSMAFAMGVGAPGSSMYSKTVGLFHVDDSKAYMQRYEEAITQISKLMEEAQLPGAYEVKRAQVGDMSALHITMDMSKFQMASAAGIPDMKRFYEMMFGPGGKMSIYLAPADEHAVVMAYVSPENLTRALEAYRAGESGLAGDAQVKKTSSLLPSSAQWIGYVSPSGAIQFATQMTAAFAPEAEFELPKFPASPPIGFAAELTRSHFDAQLVVPMETIDSVIKFVAAVRELRQ